jgi:ribosomal protein S11
MKGISKNKNLLLKSFKVVGFNIASFQESLSLPHNGCRKCSNRRI